jgi:3-hydroxyisobutyrate dehydrogenase-like beta-hydroxyacid dehydrogenase
LQIYDIADVALRMFNMDVGAIITGSPKMMAQSCDVIITVLPSTAGAGGCLRLGRACPRLR